MLNSPALFIPVFLAAAAIEAFLSYKGRDERYTLENTTTNIAIGAVDQISALVYMGLLFLSLQLVYTHFRFVTIDNLWYQWVGGYIAVDFVSYWYHRLSHRVNILWAAHVTHHSSEHFNFSNGFRTSLFQGLNRIFFWVLLPLFGFSPIVLVIILQVSGIYDFLLHTQYIPRLGFLEKILITPSLHRVHHGKNSIYIDKNYGSTFSVWDKLFGTYQPETEKVEYGITTPLPDKNPLTAITHHYQYLWNTLRSFTNVTDKIKILFMPPDWKPAIANANPSPQPLNVNPISSAPKAYALFQIGYCVAALIAMLYYKNYLSSLEIVACSVLGIYFINNSTLTLIGNGVSRFEKREALEIFITLCLTIFLVAFSYKFYLCLVMLFSLLSYLFSMYNHGYSTKNVNTFLLQE